MTPRRQRMLSVGLVAVGVVIAAGLSLKSLEKSLMFFIEISDVVAGEFPKERNFRVGGLVEQGSVSRATGNLDIEFVLTDTAERLTVVYAGILPDLFREGQGVIAHGRMAPDGRFAADEILAKHDENYMPPEVADTLAKHAAAKEALQKASTETP